MSSNRLMSRLARAWSVYKLLGFRESARRVTNKLRLVAGFPSADQRAYLDRKTATDQAFDAGASVDTGGVQHLYDLTIDSDNARYGNSCIASDPDEFAQAMNALAIDKASATFVDLGSGKGRALLLAAGYPFQRIVGVEFAAELHRTASANLRAWAKAGGDAGRIELIHGDATRYSLPETPLVLFLYNPFDAPVVAAVARQAMSSWRNNPRPMLVAYINPIAVEAFVDAGWRKAVVGANHVIFSPDATKPDLTSADQGRVRSV